MEVIAYSMGTATDVDVLHGLLDDIVTKVGTLFNDYLVCILF